MRGLTLRGEGRILLSGKSLVVALFAMALTMFGGNIVWAGDVSACSSCHAQISKTYSSTAMAHASGEAKDGVTTGEFSHKQSGMHYRVSVENGRVWMEFERLGDAAVKGRREFLYFIGSNKKGRTYLYSEQGFLFEAPINWYSQEGRWNMTPAYDDAKEAPMNLPARVECMNCHASGVQAPEPGTANKYSGRPFTNSGIACERCHGDGAAHATLGKGEILNPAKLAPARRDDICMECHFEGSVAIKQPNKRIYNFKPGERLENYLHYFVLTNGKNDGTQALSQFEALSMSACKRKSGDKMWCGSCHDPHFTPAKEQAAEYYRGKCLNCHGAAFAEKHHPDDHDCVHCHMPALPSGQVAHIEATDHRILKRVGSSALLSVGKTDPTITRFPATKEKDDARDLTLAWETLAQQNVPGAKEKAEKYSREAIREHPSDATLLQATGYIEQERGHEQHEEELYQEALAANSAATRAETDLGVLMAKDRDLGSAVKLWQDAFRRAPYRSEIGLNLAMAFCSAGQVNEARNYVMEVLDFNPDSREGKSLWRNLNRDPVGCGP